MVRLDTRWAGHPWIHYETTDSTNLRAKELAQTGAFRHGTLITADEQVAGRGRRGRVWTSPKGASVSMSLILRPEFPSEKAPMLTVLAALAMRRAIQEETGLAVEIKWPNDIVYQGKKLCGIVTEMSLDTSGRYYVVIGMGINTNITSFPEELPYAVSVRQLLGEEIDGGALIESTMIAFEALYDQFIQTEDFSTLRTEYEAHMAGKGNRVQILEEVSYCGICQGITKTGALLVIDDAGVLHQIQSGEVSVRGIYGYIE